MPIRACMYNKRGRHFEHLHQLHVLSCNMALAYSYRIDPVERILTGQTGGAAEQATGLAIPSECQ